MRPMSSIKQKILLLLLAGVALGFSYTLQKQIRIIKEIAKEWKAIDRKKLNFEIRELYKSKLLSTKENADGSLTFTLTQKGKMKALTFQFSAMKLKNSLWDGKWRTIIFDIPEKKRVERDALRRKLKELGFQELQKSVFIFPYECRDEMDFVIEFFQLRKFVRYGILSEIDNDLHLRTLFGIKNNFIAKLNDR